MTGDAKRGGGGRKAHVRECYQKRTIRVCVEFRAVFIANVWPFAMM